MSTTATPPAKAGNDQSALDTRLKANRLVQKALDALALRDIEVADALLSAAAHLDPDNDTVYICRAQGAETREEARAYYEKALEVNPENQSAATWLEKDRQSSKPQPTAAAAAPVVEEAGESGLGDESESEAESCPFCQASLIDSKTRCARCRAFLGLDDLDLLAQNELLNRQFVSEGILRLKDELGRGNDVETHMNLAVGYLNLRRSADATEHLAEACRLNPDDKELRLAWMSVLNRKSVLVVDADEVVRARFTNALESCKVRVRAARDTAEAHSFLSQETPDLVIAAMGQPAVREMEICRRLRKDLRSRKIPFLVLIEWGNVPIRNRVMGVTDTLRKPVPTSTLLDKVKELIPEIEVPTQTYSQSILDLQSGVGV